MPKRVGLKQWRLSQTHGPQEILRNWSSGEGSLKKPCGGTLMQVRSLVLGLTLLLQKSIALSSSLKKRTDEARKVFQGIPSIWMDESEALRIIRAKLAVQEKNAPLIKSLVFDREVGHIREGDTPLNSLWFSYHCILYSEAHPGISENEVAKIVKERNSIPQTFDFTMFRE